MKLVQSAQIEFAAHINRDLAIRLGIALAFIAAVMIYTGIVFEATPNSALLVASAVIGAYMAMNIGANDVANNVGPIVGSGALTLTAAIAIAAVFEAAGALIGGGDVVSTVKRGIIDPADFADSRVFIWAMMAALLGGAIWLNLATAVGAPVSTTHSIVGGVMGAGIAAQGWDVVNWESMAKIASSWVISPVMGGLIAAGFLFGLKRLIFFKPDLIASARSVIPVVIAIMAWASATYLSVKGLKNVIPMSFGTALIVGLLAAIVTYGLVRPIIRRLAPGLPPTREGVNQLFTIPLIFAAGLMSFAHGANDVANAVGPLAGIYDAIVNRGVSGKVEIPIWILTVGAVGISVGLALYGPKLIRTVGSEITELDRSRAFCIALAAAITVIVASQLGLPISSTHVALGAVFGVGFLREFLDFRFSRAVDKITSQYQDSDDGEIERYLSSFLNASMEDKDSMLKELKSMGSEGLLTDKDRRRLRKAYRRQLVKRSALLKIVSAWIITVPISALLAALFYFTLRGMLLP